jgi:hypothetical protein
VTTTDLRPPRDKREMYRMLMMGCFGNRTPQHLSPAEWRGAGPHAPDALWGLRSSARSGASGTLDVRTADVKRVVADRYADGVSISPMVDRWTVYRGHLTELDTGLFLEGVAGFPWVKWREAFDRLAHRPITGSRVWPVVRHFSSPADEEMLREVVLTYRSSTIEFTCCSRDVGVIPGHRVVVWEVRPEGGGYEGWTSHLKTSGGSGG